MRRFLAAILVATALVFAGCGSAGHYGGAVVGHHILNHVAPKHKRAINKAFCAYHVYQAVKTFRHGHHIVGALHGYSAYKSCKGGFGH